MLEWVVNMMLENGRLIGWKKRHMYAYPSYVLVAKLLSCCCCYVAVSMLLLLCCCCYVAVAMLLLLCCCCYVAVTMLLFLCCFCYVAVVTLLLLLYFCCYVVVAKNTFVAGQTSSKKEVILAKVAELDC